MTDTGADLAAELRNVVFEAEALLESVSAGGDTAEALRERVYSAIGNAKERLADLEDQTRQAAGAASAYVRENPWTVIAVAAVAGCFVGALLAGGSERLRRAPDERPAPR